MADSLTSPLAPIRPQIYQPLTKDDPSNQKFVRLLRILQGQRADILRCELEVHNLCNAPPFEALSYVWGNPEPAKVVICSSYPKKVTPNLGTALERLRYEHTERLVWIDAICVNQEDLVERSEQVKLMKDIYSQAWRVVVWLGQDEDGGAETAIRIIEKAAACCYEESDALKSDEVSFDTAMQMSQLEFELPWSKEKQQRNFPGSRYELDSANRDDWAAISRFYSNTWFTRIWIVQEVAFAPAVMYIGAREVSWTCVAAAAKWLLAKSYTHVVSDSARYRQAWMIYYLHLIKHPLSLPSLLGFVKSNATDPRDKVFALLGFLEDESRASPYLQPDYTKSLAEVYMRTVRFIIQRNAPGGGLGNLWVAFGEPPSEPDEGFPSWVYRWDLPISESSIFTNSHTNIWSASGATSQHVAEVTDPRILCLRGFKIGIVREVNNVLHERQRELERVQVLWDTMLPKLQSYLDLEFLQRAFTETITADSVNSNAEHATFGVQDLADYLSISDWRNIYEIMVERSDAISNATDLLMNVHPKAFLVAEYGQMALGPIIARPGDILCVFLGHHMPYLLRPVHQRYRFLGPCYVHGSMHGELIERLNCGDFEEEWFELE